MKIKWWYYLIAIIVVSLVIGGIGGHFLFQKQVSNFDSTKELRYFLDYGGGCEFLGNVSGLIQSAISEGKKLETEILTKQECLAYASQVGVTIDQINQQKDDMAHFICKAQIGNEIWYIEPSNFTIWLVYTIK